MQISVLEQTKGAEPAMKTKSSLPDKLIALEKTGTNPDGSPKPLSLQEADEIMNGKPPGSGTIITMRGLRTLIEWKNDGTPLPERWLDDVNDYLKGKKEEASKGNLTRKEFGDLRAVMTELGITLVVSDFMSKKDKDKAMALLKDPSYMSRVQKDLNLDMKGDYSCRMLVYLVAISAYTNDPLTLYLKGPSSSGKTYMVTQVTNRFPKCDVISLGGLSPTALRHDHAVYEPPEDGERDGKWVVNLDKKILVFLEAPSNDTIDMLKPILSHDKREISYKITEKGKKGKLEAKHTVIRGWPACLFATCETKKLDEMSTRSLLAAPDTSKAKIFGAMELHAHNMVHPWAKDTKNGEAIRNSIQIIRDSKINIIIPYMDHVSSLFSKRFISNPRVMRDFKKMSAIIYAVAFVHSFQRPTLKLFGKEYVMATMADMSVADVIYTDIRETTEEGIPKNVIMFYVDVLYPLYEMSLKFPEVSINFINLIHAHRKVYGEVLSEPTMRRNRIKPLIEAGWIIPVPDPSDKRKLIYEPLKNDRKSVSIDDVLEDVLTRVKEIFPLDGLFDWKEEVISEFKPSKSDVSNIDKALGEYSDIYKDDHSRLPEYLESIFQFKLRKKSEGKPPGISLETMGLPHTASMQTGDTDKERQTMIGETVKEIRHNAEAELKLDELILKNIGSEESFVDAVIYKIHVEFKTPEDKIEKMIEKMKQEGLLYEPRVGMIRKL